MDALSLRHGLLHEEHRSLGAKMAPFGGWEMPLQYGGVLEEHRACRESAAVFDVSHLGSVRVVGAGAHAALQWAFTNDLDRITPGRAQYTHLLDPADAHVVDDIIVWWLEAEDFLVMPNASNTDDLVAALHEATRRSGTGSVSVDDVTATRSVLAVQGPRARSLLTRIDPRLASAQRFGVQRVVWEGEECFVAGTGYTGEDGVEIHVPGERAVALWRAILALGVTPAGLGARDTLRLEAGLVLHGHELGPGITSLQAGLDWVVRFDKGDFRGREVLDAERRRGVARLLRGLAVEGRRPPRAGYRVLIDGAAIGEVTSGNFSPVFGHGIALAFLPPGLETGTKVVIDARGNTLDAEVVDLPFVGKHA